MTQTTSANHHDVTDREVTQAAAAGASLATGALLLTCGVLTVLQGISALVNDELLVIGPHYIYKFNTTGWGWVHIVVGVLLGAVAIGLFVGAGWARAAAIVMAAISIVVMFLWLPYYPVWSLVVIALDVIVIWAVSTWDSTRRVGP
ncbi:hypothetical protein GGC64_006234 [Mycobacterium sp. OAS707]|uniref:DUF7144 family membrane protein n=1 Tax=Mycobacterium sp. OAS707 TaxID=2663822 RepID=UPI00178A04FD|nr:hypothetical protein [Mycobacterium sp. OAS707]MBE1552147.1 hypothetical protein [Mycobacterium sp. OAS707]